MKLTPSKEELKLKKLIEESNKILVTGHQRIDPDAICGVLAVTKIINQLFPEKTVNPILQESHYKWPINSEKVFPGIKSVKNIPDETIDLDKYDLVIVCDADRLDRCITNMKGSSKIAVIDHHEIHPKEGRDIFINEKRSSCSEQVYVSFKRMFDGGFKVGKDIATLIYFGITADTGRFLYKSVNSETFEVVSEIFDISNANPQQVEKNSLRISRNSLNALSEALKNMRCEKNYCYSYIEKDFTEQNNITSEEVTSGGKDYFLSQLIVNTKDIDWGFVVIPTPEQNIWRVSFRAFRDTEDVERFARALGGGGHITASAANVDSNTAKEAVEVVLDTIESNPS
ncbi:MAG: bifunctional oligoribonuclease/PAP phosphatase NrnA [bacterium]